MYMNTRPVIVRYSPENRDWPVRAIVIAVATVVAAVMGITIMYILQ